MAGWQKPVNSEMVAEVGWDPDTEELIVKFLKNGKTAAYKGFDEGKVDEVLRARWENGWELVNAVTERDGSDLLVFRRPAD